MKYKIIVFFLALTLMSWAQTATQSNPTPAPEQKGDQAKPTCPCCEATAQTKDQDHHAACMRNKSSKDGGDKMACCSDKGTPCCGKDGKTCKRGAKATTACCSECKDHNKACWATKEDAKTTAMNCCGAQCPMHSGHHGELKQ